MSLATQGPLYQSSCTLGFDSSLHRNNNKFQILTPEDSPPSFSTFRQICPYVDLDIREIPCNAIFYVIVARPFELVYIISFFPSILISIWLSSLHFDKEVWGLHSSTFNIRRVFIYFFLLDYSRIYQHCVILKYEQICLKKKEFGFFSFLFFLW